MLSSFLFTFTLNIQCPKGQPTLAEHRLLDKIGCLVYAFVPAPLKVSLWMELKTPAPNIGYHLQDYLKFSPNK